MPKSSYVNQDDDILISKLNLIIYKLDNKLTQNPDFIFFDNQEFCSLMNISKKLAAKWRTDNIISFSQIGMKYYYRLSDVLIMLHLNYTPAFMF